MPSDLPMEVIDLQSSDIFKDRFKEQNLIEFYKSFPFKQVCILIHLLFGTTSAYLCEETFSKMKYVKSCYRAAFFI